MVYNSSPGFTQRFLLSSALMAFRSLPNLFQIFSLRAYLMHRSWHSLAVFLHCGYPFAEDKEDGHPALHMHCDSAFLFHMRSTVFLLCCGGCIHEAWSICFPWSFHWFGFRLDSSSKRRVAFFGGSALRWTRDDGYDSCLLTAESVRCYWGRI